jgi:hypothetical protein
MQCWQSVGLALSSEAEKNTKTFQLLLLGYESEIGTLFCIGTYSK